MAAVENLGLHGACELVVKVLEIATRGAVKTGPRSNLKRNTRVFGSTQKGRCAGAALANIASKGFPNLVRDRVKCSEVFTKVKGRSRA